MKGFSKKILALNAVAANTDLIPEYRQIAANKLKDLIGSIKAPAPEEPKKKFDVSVLPYEPFLVVTVAQADQINDNLKYMERLFMQVARIDLTTSDKRDFDNAVLFIKNIINGTHHNP